MANNITPIRQGVQPQAAPNPQDGWVWDGAQWQPVWGGAPGAIWPPPGQCGPCPPPQPSPPSCFSQVAKAQACYDQSQALYNLVSQVVMDIFTKNPGIIPSPPPGAGSGPINGVTDGSKAQPGAVGEHIIMSGTMAYAAPPNHTNGAISAGIVQPGDWDLWAYASVPTFVNGFNFSLSPLPAGISNGLTGVLGTLDQSQITTVENAFLVGVHAAASFSVPTLLAFTCDVWQPSSAGAGTGAGTMTLTVEGRRVR